ncbi:hypothetical protein HKD27_05980 [Gluconobacter sp. R75690]|uniref:hypothetical protein n=1 Tax=unclassified Gluconobacter TaxID=2644261 RepID=UPI00188B70B1|nr:MULTISPECIES: hypothetical protein [unclassified Gluconobacter]MBF0850473.1 hypothetical protein [Gluconobacter sp. R75690]MBF0879165.1 hypothetical protein [Gluconobacter sp. R75828]
MTLIELIDFLEKQDQSKVIASGWGEGSAHSYRGYYSDLAFEARSNVTIADMLAEAKSALGKEFEGYKGGEYVMGRHTDCYLAEYGSCGDELSRPLLEIMCGVGPILERAIAEAVAAERERCAKVCEAHSNSALCSAMIGGPDAQGLQNISRAHQRAAQSIRIAAK